MAALESLAALVLHLLGRLSLWNLSLLVSCSGQLSRNTGPIAC